MIKKNLKIITALMLCLSIFLLLMIQFYLLHHITEAEEPASYAAALTGIGINIFALVVSMIVAVNYIYDGKIVYADITGVHNKIAYEEHIHRLELARDTYSVGIAAFDLNGLKAVNDTLGHKAGDEYIREFSNVLAALQDNDTSAYRVGGDEFTVIFEHINEIRLKQYLNKVAEQVDRINASRKIKISYAKGYVISTPDSYRLMEELTSEADRRMYIDKRASKQAKEPVSAERRGL